MTHQPEIWEILKNNMCRGKWYHILRLYDMVKVHADLDEEDFWPQSPSSSIPKWKRNTRNVLQYRKSKSEVEWDYSTESYRL